MKRRTFIGVIAGGLLAAPLAATAQQAEKVYRIGYFGGGAREQLAHVVGGLESGLRELGYIEGRNITPPSLLLRADEVID